MTAVLIVEDEAIIRLALAGELAADGFEVVEASSAEEGLALFRGHPDIPAAVVDVHLPGEMDGYGLVRAIRAEQPSALVIIMSGLEFTPPADFDEHVIIERKPCDVRKIGHILQSWPARDRTGAETVGPKAGPLDQMPSA